MVYIDPGSGSMIVQLLIAGIVGLGLSLRKWIVSKVIKIFKGDK